MKEQIHYENARSGGLTEVSTVSIPEADFIEKAQQLRIENVKSFYSSELFNSNYFSYDAKRKQIMQTIF
uniref:DNA replication licensing factor MCM2-like winged-helix domain-containing protein n=1 Tax=Heterorhabditis bacteriophora TaxID=37862 RepID=A0A1I7XK71_HETBA